LEQRCFSLILDWEILMWWGVCGVGHYSVVDSAEDIFEESPEPLRHQQQPTPTRKLDQPLDQSVMVKVPKYRRLFVYPRIFISSVFILEFSGLFVGPNFITTKKTAQPKLNKVRCLLLNLISCSKVRVSKASTKKESKKRKTEIKKKQQKSGPAQTGPLNMPYQTPASGKRCSPRRRGPQTLP
jgi:hypothetical protein